MISNEIVETPSDLFEETPVDDAYRWLLPWAILPAFQNCHL